MAKDPIVRIKADTSQFDGKVDKAKKTLQKFGNEGGQASKALGELGKALGSEFGVLTKFAGAAGAASAALKVMKDAFFQNERNVDEWGRTVESAKGIYDGFLDAINHGSINGYLNTINTIIAKATEAYNALDDLSTYNAFSSRESARNRANYQEALANYKENPTQLNKEILTKANNAVIKDLTDQKKYNETAYIKGLESIAANRTNLSDKQKKEFVQLFSGGNIDAFIKATEKYGSGSGANLLSRQWNGLEVGYDNTLIERTKGGVVKSRRKMTPQEIRDYEFARAIADFDEEKIKEIQQLGAASYDLDTAIANQRRQFNRMAGNNGKTGGNGGGKKANGEYINYVPTVAPPMYNSISSIDARVAELQKLQNGATTFADYQKYGDMINRANMLKSIQFGSVGFGAMNIPKEIKTDTDEQGTEKKPTVVEGIGDLVNGVQGMTNSLNQMGIDIPEGINKGLGVLSGILGLVSSVCTILTAIEAIDAADAIIPFAKGGLVRAAKGFANVVPGNFMSGDRVPAMLNSGELVLNRAQTNNLAAQLSNGGLRNLKLETYASGRALRIVMNNDSQSRGMGRLVMN